MQKKLFNPGFEFIFSAGIITLLILPPVVMAQSHKEMNITINNGDTVINGKNIKSLSVSEHADALKEIDKNAAITARANGNRRVFHKEVRDMNTPDDFNERPFKHDSTREMRFGRDMMLKGDREDMASNDRFRGKGRSWNESRGRERFMGPNRRNTQSFNYTSTNNDGISTHVNFNVSDANRENMKRISGAEKADLTINDLNIVPQFSTGKTILSFSLAEKGSADVQFKDSEGKVLWSEKTSAGVNRSFELPQNGIYYLQVKQGGKLSLRRIVKEQ